MACIWLLFALVAFLADLGLAENVVRNGFNIAPRVGKEYLLWVIYFGMIAGILVFGGILKLVVSEVGALVPRYRRQVDLGFWIAVMMLTVWSLYALSTYRGSSESADGDIFTPDLIQQRKDALLAFCIALPVVAAAFFRKAADILTVRMQDTRLRARLELLAQERNRSLAETAKCRAAVDTATASLEQHARLDVRERYLQSMRAAYHHGYERGRSTHETRYGSSRLQTRIEARIQNML